MAKYKAKKMVFKRSWNTFRRAGLLWWINMQLHLFGWVIVIVYHDNGKIKEVYPARTKWRGFEPRSNREGYKMLTKHISQSINILNKEVQGS